MPINITFRTQLIGGVNEFCTESGLPLLGKTLNLVELIVLLARYQEEGVSLCPKVYLTNDIASINSMLPEGESVKIGLATADNYGIKNALKKCAPLATSGWLIYIEDNGDTIEYGVFRGSGNPIAVLVDDVVMSENAGLIVVKAFQIADDCVEIRSNNNKLHYVFLNHRKEESPPPLQYLDSLVAAVTNEVVLDVKEPTTSFLKRLLFDSLRQSHGCIIAVTKMNRPPRFLSDDGVILDSPIDFANLVHEVKKERLQPYVLDSKGYLLKGMLNSDGIIVFDNKGRLLGYNCFVKINKKDNVIGGARKRAYATLKSRVGKGLSAVFMQSQDGWTDFEGDEK